MDFNKDVLKIDCKEEIERTCSFIKEQTIAMKRDGIVIGLSGGIDSALATELCVKALGKDRVSGLILPEKDSSPVSAKFAKKQAEGLGIEYETVDITPTLESFGTYEKRDGIIKKLIPDYENSHKLKITLPPDLLNRDSYNFFTLSVDDGKGNIKTSRLNKESLLGIIAATDTKQRTRMMHLYYYAEQKNYLVCGTTNKSETIQGFFVKHGDGGVDIEPLAHLYKVQVYALSEYLGVIKEIINRAPSPDTFNFEVTDEEFYFRLPYDKLDYLLYAWENNVEISKVCSLMNLKEDQVRRVFRDFTTKYNATKHLRQLPPTLVGKMEK